MMRDIVRDPLLARTSWRVGARLDVDRARVAAHDMLGTHDFQAFRSVKDLRKDTVRTLRRVDLVDGVLGDPRLLDVIVEGDAFLHNMVRIVAGTLVDVAAGRLEPEVVARALASGQREGLGVTAPAHGLLLDEVFVAPTPEWGPSWP
ncbi:MAG: hypothetical protein NVSMB47_06470 [Polyangiales bacterium]